MRKWSSSFRGMNQSFDPLDFQGRHETAGSAGIMSSNTRALSAEDIASGDDADRLARIGGIDDDQAADIVMDHFVGGIAKMGFR